MENQKRLKKILKLYQIALHELMRVEIYVDREPIIQLDELLKKIRSRCGDVELITNNDKLILFAFKDYMVQYSEGEVPAELAIMITEKKVEKEKLEMSFRQTWGWNGAEDAVDRTVYIILITDIMASGLDYHTRLELFQKSLYSILEVTSCLAINCHLTQQIVNPQQYLSNNPDDKNYDALMGALNVRLFNIEGSDNEILMDTLRLGIRITRFTVSF